MELNTMNKLSLNLTQKQISQLQDYAHWVVKVWDEPKDGYLLRDHAIMALGLCGESSEVVETIDRQDPVYLSAELKKDLSKELGDCLYYVIMIAMAHNYDFVTNEEQESKMYELNDLPYLSGFVAEKYKKEIRKSTTVSTIDLKAPLQKYLNCLIFCCEQYSDGFLYVLQENQNKLNDRLSRNVLIGDGNNR